MKKYLSPETVNLSTSIDAVQNTLGIVRNNYEMDRSQPHQSYYFAAIIKTTHLKKFGADFPLLIRNEKNALVRIKQHCCVSSCYQHLIDKAAASKRPIIHVLIEKRLFYYETSYQEIRLVIRPDQKKLGYVSNSTVLGKKGLSFLYSVYNDKFSLSLRARMLLKLHMIAHRLHAVAQILHLNVAPQQKAA